MESFALNTKVFSTSSKRVFGPIILGLLLLLQFVLQLTLLTKGIEYIVATLTIDDSYYYFQTAWNFKIFGFPTFDGLNPTNGVQLLWFWMLALLSHITATKFSFLYAALALGFLLNALCYIIIWKWAVALERPRLAIYTASFWFLFSVGSIVYSRGLENSLHALVFWGIVWQTTTFLLSLNRGERPSLVGLTALLILNVWTRLDAAVFSLLLYGYCVYQMFRVRSYPSYTHHIVDITKSGMLALMGMCILLLAFKWMGNSYLPVSALVKESTSIWHPILVADSLLGLGMPSGLPGVLSLPIILVYFMLERFTRPYEYVEGRQTWYGIWFCLLLASAIHLIMLSPGNAPGGIPYWYRSPEYVFWTITFAMIAESIQGFISQRGFPTVARFFLVGACTAVIVVGSSQYIQRLSVYYSELYMGRYNVALWMSENLSIDTICASWNAGQLGFFSNRTVINLDGLINSADYFYRVLIGPVPLEQYLDANKVDCIVDFDHTEVPVHFPVILEFPAGNQIIRLWKVNPSFSIENP